MAVVVVAERLPIGRMAPPAGRRHPHGMHDSAVQDEIDSDRPSRISIRDHLHRTFRPEVQRWDIRIGVRGY